MLQETLSQNKKGAGGVARAAAQMESLVACVTDILDPSTEKNQQPKHTPSTEKSSKILENKNNRQMYALLNVSLWKETSWLLAACGAQFLFTLGRKGPRAPLHMQQAQPCSARGGVPGQCRLTLPPSHPLDPAVPTYLTLLNRGWRNLLDDL